LSPQPAVLGAFESDASHAKAAGLSPKAGLLCQPTLSTHGYEVIAHEAIPAMTAVLVEFIQSYTGKRTYRSICWYWLHRKTAHHLWSVVSPHSRHCRSAAKSILS
jgi:hypothetical protein